MPLDAKVPRGVGKPPSINSRAFSRLGPVGGKAVGGIKIAQPWRPRNNRYAGKLYPVTDGRLRRRFGPSVPFTKDGCPNFSKFQHPKVPHGVKIKMQGNHRSDYRAALAKTDLKRRPKGYTWHHHQDMKTMQLIPTKIHNYVKHSGGVSRIKYSRKLQGI